MLYFFIFLVITRWDSNLKTFFDIILSYYASTSLYYTTRVTCIIFITLRHSNRSHICLSSGSIILDQALNLILDIQIYMVKREMSVYKKYTEFRTPEATFLTKILTHTHHLAPATSFRIRRRSEKKTPAAPRRRLRTHRLSEEHSLRPVPPPLDLCLGPLTVSARRLVRTHRRSEERSLRPAPPLLDLCLGVEDLRPAIHIRGLGGVGRLDLISCSCWLGCSR
jgi:hypothetical protein